MRQLLKYTIGVLISFLPLLTCVGQSFVNRAKRDSIPSYQRTLISLGEIVTLNMGVWAFDRYIAKSDFAYINRHTIKENLSTGFVWDNDQIGTNFIMHPYHGSLYFNAARSNGFNYYESIPFTMIGSLMWECFLENEPPSINDLLTTTAAGSMYGEITYRLSNKVIDNSASGANRVFREIVAGILSPVHEINRLISGDAWKRSYTNIGNRVPLDLNVSAGCTWLKPQFGKDYLLYAQIAAKLDYNPQMEEVEQPYDWFSVDIRFNTGHRSFYVNKMDVTGVLWNKPYVAKNGSEWGIGVYQHFDYWDSPTRKYQKTPYRFAQVLALGPGVYYRSKPSKDFSLCWKGYLTGIGLGGALSDYYWVDMRDYSFGSGMSAKTALSLSAFDNQLRLNITAGNYTLFTWKGYQANRVLHDENIKKLNVQGDQGYTNFTSLEAELGYWSKEDGWNICLAPELINRYTNYKFHPSQSFSTWNLCVKAGYTLKIR